MTGASNIQVGSAFYDVTFTQDSFENIFGSTPAPSFLDTEAEALLFATALSELVLIDIPGGASYDSDPLLTNCSSNGSYCAIRVPYSVELDVQVGGSSRDLVSRAIFVNHPTETSDRVATPNPRRILETSTTASYAIFTASQVNAVPEPSSMAMLICGCLFLMGMRRRHQT